MRPVRCLKAAAGLDTAQHGQQIGCGDLADRPCADPGEDVALKPADDLLGVRRCPGRRELGEPFARHGLEAVRVLRRRVLRQLSGLAGVNALSQQAAGFVAALACRSQWRVGLGAHRHRLSLAVKTEVEAPPLTATGLDQQLEAATVGQLARRVAGLRVTDGRR